MTPVPAASRVVLGRMVTLVLSSFVSALVGMGRELVVASRFGTSDSLDAYVVAVQAVTYVVGLGAVPLAAVLIPAYVITDEKEGRAAADELFRRVVGLGFLILTVLSLCVFLASGPVASVLAPGFDAVKSAASAAALRTLAPAIVMSGASLLYAAVLNARERFLVVALAPVMRNVVFAGVILTSAERTTGALSRAALLAFGAELATIFVATRRQGFPVLPRFPRIDAQLKNVANRLVHVTASTVLVSMTPLIDQAFASTHGAGEVATLAYGTKLVSVLLAICVSALATVLLPHLSRLAARGDSLGIAAILRIETRAILLGGGLVSLLVATTAPWTIELVFERGAFDSATTARVAAVHAICAAQIPFYLLSSILVRTLNAVGASRYYSMSAIVLVLINLSCDAWFSSIAGVRGIAGTSVVLYASSSIGAYVYLRRKLASMSANADLIAS